MGFDLRAFQSARVEAGQLAYDADGVELLGLFTDELSAYRARRDWVEILGSYFLLETDRDFSLKIEFTATEELPGYVLRCNFSSACGRYAFWRLINRQAPEAEQLLARGKGRIKNISSSKTPRSETADKESWMIASDYNKSYGELLRSALKRFQRLL